MPGTQKAMLCLTLKLLLDLVADLETTLIYIGSDIYSAYALCWRSVESYARLCMIFIRQAYCIETKTTTNATWIRMKRERSTTVNYGSST